MSGTWWTRFLMCVAVLSWGTYMLVPTFIGESATAVLERQAAAALAAAEGGADADAAKTEAMPWWASVIPDAKLNLAIDLRGGIDMTLRVEVDEAVISSVQRDVRPFRDAAEKEGLRLADVHREPGAATLLVRPEQGSTTGAAEVTAFVQKRYSTYEPDGTRTVDGVEYLAFRVTEAQATYIRQRSVEQALETLRSRIDETGVKEANIVIKGEDNISIQLPGVADPDEAIAAVGTTALLEFMMVDEEVGDAGTDRIVFEAEPAAPPETWKDDEALSDWLVREGRIPANDRLLWEYGDGAKSKERQRAYVVRDEVILTGDDVNDASTRMNQYNEPYVALSFKPRGGKIFADVTGENIGRHFAIVLDHKVRSAPNIREKISGGQASIEMGVVDYQQALNEAKVLSLVLRTGALPAPVTVAEVRQVGPSLGADAIKAGTLATALGALLVVLFMVGRYRVSGAVAVVALAANGLLVMALMAAAGAALSLPGIAGLALTIGMAVDCNIIIYERIREEIRDGRNARAATDTGFEKAFSAVLDGNLTTFIAGVVLYTYGTGPIKGFAVTLMIGICTTLFTGVTMSRMMMDFLSRRATARLSI